VLLFGLFVLGLFGVGLFIGIGLRLGFFRFGLFLKRKSAEWLAAAQ
jgi:hypothetical protein